MNADNEKTLYIRCGDTVFEFPLRENDDAWYCLDKLESINGDEKLRINADRDVYAVYTDRDGAEHYGTIGDDEDKVIADNSSCDPGTLYIFYENPEAKNRYL